MRTALILVLFAGCAAETPWADWECPGFPCFIVNFYFNMTKAGITDLKKTCGPFEDFTPCMYLENGETFSALNSTGGVVGTHTLKKPHPCHSRNYGCVQTSCVQGSEAACQGYCDDLALVPHYKTKCYDFCSVECGPTPPAARVA